MKRTVILPHYDNDGVALSHEAILSQVLDIVGGYSTTEICGRWKGEDGHVYTDTSLEVTMVYDSMTVDHALCSLLPHWCYILRQECLLTTTTNTATVFVEKVAVAA